MTGQLPAEAVPLVLNPDGVAAPIHRSVRVAAEAIAICLPASEAYDFAQEFEIGPVMHRMRFQPVADPEGRRAELSAWITGQAIGEVARGIRAALEEAYLFATIVVERPETLDQLGPLIDRARRDANDWPNPRLMDRLGRMLTSPLTFAAELTSLQRLRNCLEHRGGIVGEKDIADGDRMVLTLPRLALMHHVDGEPREVQPGVPEGAGNQLWAERVNRETAFHLGERITFSADQLGEVFLACHFLAADLLTRLPMPPVENQDAV